MLSFVTKDLELQLRQDHRLSRVLHAILHLEAMDGPATSELIAKMLQTNSVVVRRMMAGLREAGIVTSTKGHGGGWSLAKPVDQISLFSIYEALGSPPLFAIGNGEKEQECLLAQAANTATNNALEAARAEFKHTLKSISVAQLRDKTHSQVPD